MDCLDDDTVYQLVVGELAAAQVARADVHLDSCGNCRALVALVARGSGSSGGPDGNGLARGAVIGRYVIGDVVGGGAMGVVYAAWDPELDRRVALKVLREEERAREKMLREAQAMARLAHPNVVTVHEVGIVEGQVFVAMELVAGTTLGGWAAERRWEEICEVMVQVGRGLAAAHAAGVVHRDVKPDNVIVGEDGRARIGDFGLARGTAASDPEKPGTGTGSGVPATGVAGTPVYMAPEVLRGGAADARSDQFGFCVSFFEALHGERPFVGRSWSELLAAIERGAIATGRRPVPGWLAAVVRRGLSARPDDRWPSIDALLAAIATRRQARTRRWLWAAGAVAVGSLATAAAVVASRGPAPAPAAAGPSCDLGDDRVAAVWNHQARSRLRGALVAVGAPWAVDTADRVITSLDAWTAGWAASLDEVCLGSHVRRDVAPEDAAARSRCLDRRHDELGALIDRLADADRSIALRAVDAVAALPAPGECLEVAAGAADPLPADPERRAAVDDVVHQLATLRAALAVGDWRRALADAPPLVTAATAAGHSPTLAEAELARAAALRAGGDSRGADGAALASLWAAERGHDDVGAARAWLELAALAGERRDLIDADQRARHAEAAVARAGEPRSLVALLDGTRGLIAYNRGQLDVAEPLLTAALKARRELYGEDDVAVARAWSSLGSLARARGRLDDARRLHDTALAIDRRRLGPGHPDVARDLHNVAGVQRLAGDLEAALATYREALAIELAGLGSEDVATGLTRNSIGLVLMALDRLDDAERELTASLVVLAGADHGDRALAMHNLGLLSQRRGSHPAALRWFDDAMAVYRTTIGEDAEGPVRLLLDRAVSERAVGHDDRARQGAKAARDKATRLVEVEVRGAGAVKRDAEVMLGELGGIDGSAAEVPAPVTDTYPGMGVGSEDARDVGVYGSGQAWP